MATPTITTTTPPKVTGQSWLGVDPSQRMNAATAKRGLTGYLGRDWTTDDTQRASTLLGRQFTSDDDELTGDEYNRLLQEGARLTGNTFTPYSTTGGPTPSGETPGINPNRPTPSGPAPTIEDVGPYQGQTFDGSAYQGQRFEAPDPAALANDPAYRFMMEQGQRAVENRASARGGTRGGNLMRELTEFGQGLASTEYGNTFNRALQTHQANDGVTAGNFNRALAGYQANEDTSRFGYGTQVARAERNFAPQLLDWQQRNRENELAFDRDWQREIYGRDDAWRRHTYANDDAYRRWMAEENRRLRLAEMGLS